MERIEAEHKDHRLIAVPQSDGGYVVEITPTRGGKSFMTTRCMELSDAMANARALLDRGFRP